MTAPSRVLVCTLLGSLLVSIEAVSASAAATSLSRFSDHFHAVGHDIVVDPAVRRFTAKVIALGKPEDDGRIYSFKVEPVGPGMGLPVAKELKGWRLTMLSGERFLSVFEVADNNASDIVVARTKEGLNGLAPGDVLIIESISPQTGMPAT
jgi:hypothetical protein